MKRKREYNNENYTIGTKVVKVSGKPFKHGGKISTVKSVTINENTNRIAYLFEEDNSVVDCHICKLYTENKG